MSNERETQATRETSEGVLERIHDAREELDELIAEQRRLDQDIEQARVEDSEERLKAVVRNGDSIRGAVSSLVRRVRRVEDWREVLSELIWTARMRLAQLEAEYNAARYAELQDEVPGARTEFQEVDALLHLGEKRRERALDRVNYLRREMGDLKNRREEARSEPEALKKAGYPQGREGLRWPGPPPPSSFVRYHRCTMPVVRFYGPGILLFCRGLLAS